jgi:hypothetical protein
MPTTDERVDSLEHTMGSLMICLCKYLDPCCLQEIATTACKEKGLGDPRSVAALLCILSQWCARNQGTTPVGLQYLAQQPHLGQQPQALYSTSLGTPPAAAPCTTDLMPFIFQILTCSGIAKRLAILAQGEGEALAMRKGAAAS